jgi:hypothetical protein
MNKEEMTATILAYSVELRDEYNEMVKEFRIQRSCSSETTNQVCNNFSINRKTRTR